MRLPASFGRKAEPSKEPETAELSKEPETLVVPESLSRSLTLTLRRVKSLTTLNFCAVGLLVFLLFLAYSLKKIQVEKIDPLIILAQFNLVIVLLLTLTGLLRYSLSLRNFLNERNDHALLSLLKSSRAMWAKIGIGLLMMLTIVGISVVRLLMFPPGS